MIKPKSWPKAQSMAEYAVILAVIIAALAAMGVFFRGSLQKQLWNLSTQLGDKPYAPRNTVSSSQSDASSSTTENYRKGITTVNYGESSSRQGNETVYFETR